MLVRRIYSIVKISGSFRSLTSVSQVTKTISSNICRRCFHRYYSVQATQDLPQPVFLQAEKYPNKVAIIDQHGSFKYQDLLHYSKTLSQEIIDQVNGDSKHKTLPENTHVAFLCNNDVSYVVAQWATWMAGGVAVPLCKSHPQNELEYVIQDAQCSIVLTTADHHQKIEPITKKLSIPLRVLEKENYTGYYEADQNAWFIDQQTSLDCKNLVKHNNYKNQSSLIIYTSGTTGRPKGVVLTFGNIHCNITGMMSAWEWTSNDVILHVLPLHHVHGVVNALMVPLYCGATCVMLPKFDERVVWEKLAVKRKTGIDITIFMAVPTIYAKLIEYYEKSEEENQLASQFLSASLENIRLMVSGSAALPRTVMDKWKAISGHTLLERYGMTELGMVLTNPLHGERIPGAVGHPFPGVRVAISKPNVYSTNSYDVIAKGNSTNTNVTKGMEGEQGELLVKGPTVFKEYWKNPSATKSSFTKDGWFKTGDTAVYTDGVYRIMGRTSVDIIKSGGYKISALDIERHLLEHPDILECVVVGLHDITWGQKVAAVIVTKSKQNLKLFDLKSWCRDKLPSYQIPSELKNVSEIPKNAMGKVNKKEIVKQLFNGRKV
ncbi:malonate--CoA ligase ACSF3, mitochondrial-like isoform X1 [Mytilus trossulus]|uniref:malonate--CoA ligase ACSF3, mitochondrial-like isoform X1 n=1 Tax=Mytilus trossulus TaxID=6551 RepID=UPI0030077FCC